jgi:hypothetical protein
MHRELLGQLMNRSTSRDDRPEPTTAVECGYFRLQTTLTEADFAMDNVRQGNRDALQREADQLIAANTSVLDALIPTLTRSSSAARWER